MARAIDLEICGSILVSLTDVRPATFLKKGKVEEIAALVEEKAIGLVMMDCGTVTGSAAQSREGIRHESY